MPVTRGFLGAMLTAALPDGFHLELSCEAGRKSLSRDQPNNTEPVCQKMKPQYKGPCILLAFPPRNCSWTAKSLQAFLQALLPVLIVQAFLSVHLFQACFSLTLFSPEITDLTNTFPSRLCSEQTWCIAVQEGVAPLAVISNEPHPHLNDSGCPQCVWWGSSKGAVRRVCILIL